MGLRLNWLWETEQPETRTPEALMNLASLEGLEETFRSDFHSFIDFVLGTIFTMLEFIADRKNKRSSNSVHRC